MEFKLFVLLICLSNASALNPTKVEVRIIPGIYLAERKDVTLYESSVPITFELQLPALYKLGELPPCEDQRAPYLCELANATYTSFEMLRNEYLADFPYLARNISTTGNFTTVKRGLFNAIGALDRYLWGTATEDQVNELHMRQDDMEKRQHSFESQVANDHKSIIELTKNLGTYSTQIHSYLRGTVQSIENTIKAEMNSVAQSEAAIAFSLNHILHWIHFEHTVSSLQFLEADCRANRIPRNLLSRKVVVNKLDQVASDIETEGWEIAANYAKLISLSVTKCVFTENKVWISIQVPIKRVGKKMRLFELTPVPFRRGDDQCIIDEATEFVVNDGLRVIPINKYLARKCQVYEQSLCEVPQYQRDVSSFGQCAAALLGQPTPEILSKVCAMKCHKSNAKPIVHVNAKEIIVANFNKITCNCTGKAPYTYSLPNMLGAALVKHPCGCTIMLEDMQLEPPFPCNKDEDPSAAVVHIVPGAWAKARSMLLDNELIRYRNVSDAVDLAFYSDIPLLNISDPKTVLLDDIVSGGLKVGTFRFEDELIILWLVALTTGLTAVSVYLVWKGKGRTTMSPALVPAAYMSLLPGARGSNINGDIADATWELLLETQMMQGFLIMYLLLFLVVSLYMCYKVLKFIRTAARCIEKKALLPDLKHYEAC